MKYLLLIFILFSLKLYSQSTISNQKTLGGSDHDNLSSVVMLSDNSIVVSGYSYSQLSGDKTSSAYGSSDYWLVKLDSNLTPIWQKSYGGAGSDVLNQIIKTKDDNILCIGHSNSVVSGNKTAANIGITDLWVIKLDSNGNELWQKTYGGSGADAYPSVAEDTDGNLYFSSSSSSGISGDKTDSSRGYADFWLIKTDASGNKIWDKTYGGDDFETYPHISIIDSSSQFVLFGNSISDSSGEKSENSIKLAGTNSNSEDIWVLKLDSLGNILWDRTFGGDMFDDGDDIFIDNEKIYIVAATESGVSGNKLSINKGNNDFWLIGLDMNGNKFLDKSFGGIGDEGIGFIIKGPGMDQILIGGNSSSGISGDKTESRIGSYDCWILSLDTVGNINWQETIGGAAWEGLSDAFKINDNKFLFAGSSDSGIGADKTENNRGGNDYWLVELTLSTVGIGELTNKPSVRVFPNPASSFVYFEVGDLVSEQLQLKIMDITGQMLIEEKLSSSKAKLDVSEFKSGIYLFSIFSNGYVVGNGKIIVE